MGVAFSVSDVDSEVLEKRACVESRKAGRKIPQASPKCSTDAQLVVGQANIHMSLLWQIHLDCGEYSLLTPFIRTTLVKDEDTSLVHRKTVNLLEPEPVVAAEQLVRK